MKYVKVASTSNLPEGSKLKISLEDKTILLTNINNSYYAVDNKCPHMGGSLYDGELQGNHIVCPKHGSVFDVTNGEVVQNGKMFFINVKVHKLAQYPVKIENTDIMIGIEENEI